MRTLILSALALVSTAFIPGQASAADENTDRTHAIELCRTQVSQQAGVEIGQARLDQARVRGHSVRVDIDLWSNGSLRNVRCDVTRGDTLQIASITPALTTATAAVSN